MKNTFFGLMAIIFVIIGVLLFVKGKEIIFTKEIKPLISSLHDLNSVAIKDKEALVAILEDGSEIILLNLDNYSNISYDLYHNKIYLYLTNIDNMSSFYLIDLTVDNNFLLQEIIKLDNEFDNQLTNHIQAYNNFIYFIPSFKTTIHYFDVTAKVFIDTKINTTSPDIIIEKNRGLLLYQDGNNIYEYNIKHKKNNKLFENSTLSYLYSDKIIYKNRRIGNNDTYIDYYYEYDYGANFARKLFIANPNGSYLKGTESVVSNIDNSIYVNKKNEIYQLFPDISNEHIYSAPFNVDFIIKMGSSKVMLHSLTSNTTIILDLITKNHTAVDYYYHHQINIK